MAKDKPTKYSVTIEAAPREDAPKGYVPPSTQQVEAAVKAQLEHEHEAFEVTVTAKLG